VTLLSKVAAPCRHRLPLPGNAFQLPLAAKVGLELGEHALHAREALAGRRAGIDRLLRGLQDRAARPDSANDVLKVSDAPGAAIDAG
jgi:hypothetical protein